MFFFSCVLIINYTYRSLATVRYFSDKFTAEQVGATQPLPGEWGLPGECVGQPKSSKQRQGQTWSNSCRQREQNSRLSWILLTVPKEPKNIKIWFFNVVLPSREREKKNASSLFHSMYNKTFPVHMLNISWWS